MQTQEDFDKISAASKFLIYLVFNRQYNLHYHFISTFLRRL